MSSIAPLNHSPHTLLPPIRSAPDVWASVPAAARLATCSPFTNSRWVVPSNVVARCDQALSGSVPVPQAARGPDPVLMTPSGFVVALLAYSPYAKSFEPSFTATLRQFVSAVGYTHPSTVMPVVRFRAAVPETVTMLSTPLKVRAPPFLPVGVHVAPLTTPSRPPIDSRARLPTPSSNDQAATGPDGGVVAVAAGTVTATFSKVAVVSRVGAWLVTASPTYTSSDIGTLSVPTSVHVVPSLDSDAINDVPTRLRRSQVGAVPGTGATRVVDPPRVFRCSKTMPFAGVMRSDAWTESALSS